MRWSVVFTVAFAPDGGLFATGGSDRKVRLWDATSGRYLRTLRGHRGGVTEVLFSPHERLLATGAWDRKVRLWDTTTGRCLHILPAETESGGPDMAFSPDGCLLAITDMDQTVQLWNPASGRLLRTLPTHNNGLCSMAFSPDGSLLATSGHNEVHLCNSTTGESLRTLGGHTRYITALAFSPDGRLLATGDGDRRDDPRDADGYFVSEDLNPTPGNGTVRLWDVTTGQLAHEPMNWFSSPVKALAFSPDGQYLAAGNLVRDMATGTPHKIPHPCNVIELAFSPNGRLMATVGADRKVRLWNY